jgi:hypothetical protein
MTNDEAKNSEDPEFIKRLKYTKSTLQMMQQESRNLDAVYSRTLETGKA